MKGIWFEVGVLYCWGERGDYIGLVGDLGGGLRGECDSGGKGEVWDLFVGLEWFWGGILLCVLRWSRQCSEEGARTSKKCK